MRNGLVEGVSLRAVLRESGAMAPEAAASVLAGMLVTLAVVHGDVCPEHVRVDGSGGLALTDFGETAGEAEARFVPNVPSYLAPERLNGAAASPVADVFSATAVFFECLTNESPFVAATREDLAALHEYAEVIAEFAPPELRSVAQRGLAPDAARRPASPHAFLDEVTATATAVYGADWQQRGRALLGGWAAAAARAAGTELVAAAGPNEAPPVGEPIDEALLGLSEEMPPPMGEPIDEALLNAEEDQVPDEEEAEATAETEASAEDDTTEDDAGHDWFSRAGKTGSAAASTEAARGAEADVLAAFGGARAVRAAEAEPEPYTPTGFDVFADRSSTVAAEADSEPVSGHWDEPEAGTGVAADESEIEASGGEWVEVVGTEADSEPAEEGGASTADDVLGDSEHEVATADALTDAEHEATADDVPAGDALADGEQAEATGDALDDQADSQAAEPEADTAFDAFAGKSSEAPEAEPESEPPIEDSSELLSAFDAFSSPPTAEPEPVPEPEPEAAELLPEPEAASASEAEAEPVAEESEPEPEDTPPPDLEDDWVIPTTPTPKVPRSLSAFALSLPSLPRPQAEVEEPKPVVQTSAPDDWFRPGVAEPVGVDAHHTRVLNPDRDNTIESEATRMLDEVSEGVAAGAAEKGAAAATVARGVDYPTHVGLANRSARAARAARVAAQTDQDRAVDDDDYDDEPAAHSAAGGSGSGGPRRKTVVGAVVGAVLLVAGAAAVVIGGSGKAPEGSGGTPTGASSTNAPTATTGPNTPTGTSAGDGLATDSVPTAHRSPTRTKSHSSSPSTSSHSSSDESASHSSSSSASQSSSSSAPSSSAPSSPTGSCIPIILPCDAPSSSSNGGGATPGT